MNTSDVAVVGAGIAGLATALLLSQAGHRVRVYERDSDVEARDQGGSIGIDGELGGGVIRRMGLEGPFEMIADRYAVAGRVSGASGPVLVEHDIDPDSGDAEVERPLLRRMLLDALPPGTVCWGRRSTGVEAVGSRVRVRFSDGGHVHADLVVGADGAWSRVRPGLAASEPAYSGVTFLDRRFPDVDTNFPDLARTIGRGTLFALEGGFGMIAQRIGANARVYIAFRAALDWVQRTPYDALRAELARAFWEAGWDEPLMRLLTDGHEPGTTRPVFEHPVGHRWDRRLAATLVGDAAHLQSPFCALGTNNALLDAADLADALAAASTVDDALERYHERMWRRSSANADAAHSTLRAAMDVQAPAHYLAVRSTSSCRPGPVERFEVPRFPNYLHPLIGGATASDRREPVPPLAARSAP